MGGGGGGGGGWTCAIKLEVELKVVLCYERSLFGNIISFSLGMTLASA